VSDVDAAFAALAPPRARCAVSVAIPARNERDSIVPALEAFLGQRTDDGAYLDPECFEVIVFANDCADDTAARVRALATMNGRFAIHVVEAALQPRESHVGAARRAAMNASAARMMHLDGIVATTDADTQVGAEWVARTIAELQDVEALGGRVVQADADANGDALCGRVRALEHRYRYAVVWLESLLDPLAHDPWPRHGNHQGASLALRAQTYARVGGIPALPVLEDFALYKALLRADVRFRHSLRVRVKTSGRRKGRVEGGFASQLHAIDAHVAGREPYLVEHPSVTAALSRGRGALRRADLLTAANAFGLAREALARHLLEATTMGAAIEAVEHEALAWGGLRRYARVPIDAAIRVLENYRAGLRSSSERATRIKA
jgi:hypothetical protein